MDVVYIDDQIIDLDPDTKIAWTIQRVDIGDLSKNYSSFSNTIKAGDTEKNNRTFQNAKLDNSDGTFQYAFQDFRLVQNGVETASGKAIVTGFDGNNYTLVLYDSFVSLLSFINGKKLADIDIWGTEAWNAAGIDTARLKTTGLVNAFSNWGRSLAYEQNYYLPFFYYSTLITEILKLTGLTPQGGILSNTDFTDLAVSHVDKFIYPEATLINVKRTATSSSQSLTLSIDQAFISISFPQVDYGTLPLTDTFVSDVTVNIRYNSLNFTIDVLSASKGDVRIYGSIQGLIATSPPITLDYTNSDQIYTFTGLEFLTGETVEVRFYFNKDAGYPGDSVFVDVGNGGNGTSYTIAGNTTVPRSKPYWKRLVNNDVTISDCLKDFFVRFGIIYKVNGNAIELKTNEEICTDTSSAVDWTNKRVNRKKSLIDFKTTYAQANDLSFSDSIDFPDAGAGSLSINNSTLQSKKSLFKSALKNAKMWTGSIKCLTFPVYDSGSTGISDIKNSTPFCLATLRNRTNEAAITFDAIARTDYKIAYFLDNTRTKDSSFAYFLSKYYPSLTLALQKNKICKYQYNLNETDIANYDPHKMIFDNGSYYLINKISNFRSGKITTVELFKIQ